MLAAMSRTWLDTIPDVQGCVLGQLSLRLCIWRRSSHSEVHYDITRHQFECIFNDFGTRKTCLARSTRAQVVLLHRLTWEVRTPVKKCITHTVISIEYLWLYNNNLNITTCREHTHTMSAQIFYLNIQIISLLIHRYTIRNERLDSCCSLRVPQVRFGHGKWHIITYHNL